MNKTLILYYSLEGSTEKIANHLAKELNFDIEKITPKKEIKAKGFTKYLIGGYQSSFKRKPKLNPIKHDIDKYETIIIGSPIWAGTLASPTYSLLEGNLINSKNIALFYTHKGGDKKAKKRIEKSVMKKNKLISLSSFINVSEDLEKQKEKALKWAKTIK